MMQEKQRCLSLNSLTTYFPLQSLDGICGTLLKSFPSHLAHPFCYLQSVLFSCKWCKNSWAVNLATGRFDGSKSVKNNWIDTSTHPVCHHSMLGDSCISAHSVCQHSVHMDSCTSAHCVCHHDVYSCLAVFFLTLCAFIECAGTAVFLLML